MSFSIDILKDTLAELEMYQFVEQTKLPQKEYEENVADLKKTIKALESNNFNDFIHSVSGSFLCGHDQHGYRKCHEQCGECKEQQEYCEDCGDWAGCDNEDCQYFKGNDR